MRSRDRHTTNVVFERRGGKEDAELEAEFGWIWVLDPKQPNRAYDILRTKFRRSPSGEARGWGLKIFP